TEAVIDRAAALEMDAGGRVKPWEKAFLHRDGHVVPCLLGVVPLPEDTGLCFALDLTEIKLVQASLEKAKAQLEEAMGELQKTQDAVVARERLHALGQMASGIAHDFNNALSPILGYSEMLIAKPELAADQGLVLRRLATINRAAGDAAHVVQRLREFFRTSVEGETAETVDMADIAQQAIDLTKPRWADQAMASGIQYRIDPRLAHINVHGIASELREALVNLILNALDAMPNGGDLKVDVSAVEGSPE